MNFRRKILSALLILAPVRFFAQEALVFDPVIVVTYPKLTSAKGIPDSLLAPYVLTPEQKLRNLPDTINERSESVRLMEVKETAFANTSDFYGEFSMRLNAYLGYNLIDHFKGFVTYSFHEQLSPDVNTMKAFALKERTNWVVNIRSVNVTGTDGQFTGEAAVCIYNFQTDKIIFDKSYVLAAENHGSMYACQSGSIDCLINDFVYKAGDEILKEMLKEKDYWVKK